MKRDTVGPELSALDREAPAGATGLCVWLTGLSASGKSTISRALVRRLRERGASALLLDGDELRRGLCSDLGFSPEDRAENNRRAAEVAALLVRSGVIVVAAFISPSRRSREAARAILPPGGFAEVYVRCPLPVCEARDPKGLYARARGGSLPGMTGIGAPYEEPERPDLVLDTGPDEVTAEMSASTLLAWLDARTDAR